MAIQVGGTTVIDNSRNLQNVGGLKTINSTSILGSGNIEAGASTDAGAVGTYLFGRPKNYTDYTFGDTATSLYPVGWNTLQTNANNLTGSWSSAYPGSVQSGTWRCMSMATRSGTRGYLGLWVRIS
jgi:hypothetical protein